ncbi:MAG: thioredoxin family protein [Pirellulales bacterium]|nr:thioredoxin family protein [Pirellulales bacterium]
MNRGRSWMRPWGGLALGLLPLLAGGCPCRTSQAQGLAPDAPRLAPDAPRLAPDAPRVGRQIAAFELGDVHGRPRSLADFRDAKLVVVAFLGTECPLVTLYTPRLNELAESYAGRGVQFVGINSNQQDSLTELADFAHKYNVAFPLLKDPGNRVADVFGAVRTPEVFVLDGDRVVRYWGRIDDQYVIGAKKQQAEHADLKDALEQLLSGREVAVPTTKALGCLIGRVKRPDPAGEITYANQVSRLLQKRCVECHHDGQIAPFALTSYDEVLGWAEMIQEVVHERRMPPWLAAPGHGQFKNDPSLSTEEVALIDRWVAGGCPQGDEAELPAPAAFEAGWGISKPDEIFYMSDTPFQVPAEGVVDYQLYDVDPGFTEDKWIREAEVKCSAAAVVHHVIVFIGGAGGGRFGAPQMAYAPGMTPRRFDQGMAIRAPAGCRLTFQVHYTPNGTAQADRSYVGFVYADPSEVTHEVEGGACGDMAFRIPPGDDNYRVVADRKFLKDTVLLGMNPHMHVRGKAFRYELLSPDGQREILLDVPRYDFNWQLWYNLEQPRLIPKGSKMICTAYFDNSEHNPANPDPNQTVTWGEQTWDEMMFGFFSTIRPLRDKTTAVARPVEALRPGVILPARREVAGIAPLRKLAPR